VGETRAVPLNRFASLGYCVFSRRCGRLCSERTGPGARTPRTGFARRAGRARCACGTASGPRRARVSTWTSLRR